MAEIRSIRPGFHKAATLATVSPLSLCLNIPNNAHPVEKPLYLRIIYRALPLDYEVVRVFVKFCSVGHFQLIIPRGLGFNSMRGLAS